MKLSRNMTLQQVILTMANGDSNAMSCLINLLSKPSGMLDVFLLDSLEVYEKKICNLFACCNNNLDKVQETIQIFRKEMYTKEEIHEHLEKLKPFI